MNLTKLFAMSVLVSLTVTAGADGLENKEKQSGMTPGKCLELVKRSCLPTQSENDKMRDSGFCQQSGEKFVFVSNNRRRIYSVETSACTTSGYSIEKGQGKIVDMEAFRNRMFLVLDSHHVIAIGKNNSILELKNAKNKPYAKVDGVSEAFGDLVFSQSVGGNFSLTAEQVDKKIAKSAQSPLAVSESTDPLQTLIDIIVGEEGVGTRR